MSDKQQPGTTARSLLGKLNNEDKGEIAVAFSTDNGRVVMEFGSKVSWVALTKEQAMSAAVALQKMAERL